MKYVMLIHQGTSPTPRSPEAWATPVRGRAARRSTPTTRPSTRRPASRPACGSAARRPRPPCASQDGKTLTTDGPFVDTKEALGGYFIFEADDLDAAIELAARVPAARLGGAIEVRPDRAVVASLDQAFRDEWGRVLATLIGFLGDFDLAEEAAQEAFAIAAERWPRDGTPDNPGAWLTTTARNRAINRIRRDRTLAAKTRLLEVPQAVEDTVDETTFPDERLELIFTCCHPALATDAQVALTLRTLGGLTTDRDRPRVPRARGDDGPAAGARQAQDQGRRDPVPRAARPPAARPAGRRARRRLPDLQRGLRGAASELAAEAIRLGRALAELMPDEPEVHGLLALMLLHDSRRDARFRDGELRAARRPGPLAAGTRGRSPTGRAALDRALALRGRGPYVIQAAIASLHADEPRDWPQIAALYGELARLTGSPVVELNRAVAVAEADGPEAGSRSSTASRLDDYRYLHSTRGELLRRLGRHDEAREAYRRALELSHDDADRRLLERRLDELAT